MSRLSVSPVLFLIAVGFAFLFCACSETEKPPPALSSSGADTVNLRELSLPQQRAVLELIRRDREVTNLRRIQENFRSLYSDLADLRAHCLPPAPGRSYAHLDSIMAQVNFVIVSGTILADALDPTEDLIPYVLKVQAVREEQKILIKGCGLLLVLFIENGCDDRPLRKKYGAII